MSPITPSQIKELVPSPGGNFCQKFLRSLQLPYLFWQWFQYVYKEDGTFSDQFIADLCATDCECGDVPPPITDCDSGIARPRWISATDGVHSDKVVVSWEASTGATSYTVFRSSSDSFVNADELGSTTATTYEDTTGTKGTIYYYYVRATTVAGASCETGPDTGYSKKIDLEMTIKNGSQGFIPYNLEYPGFEGNPVCISFSEVFTARSYNVYVSETADFDDAELVMAFPGRPGAAHPSWITEGWWDSCVAQQTGGRTRWPIYFSGTGGAVSSYQLNKRLLPMDYRCNKYWQVQGWYFASAYNVILHVENPTQRYYVFVDVVTVDGVKTEPYGPMLVWAYGLGLEEPVPEVLNPTGETPWVNLDYADALEGDGDTAVVPAGKTKARVVLFPSVAGGAGTGGGGGCGGIAAGTFDVVPGGVFKLSASTTEPQGGAVGVDGDDGAEMTVSYAADGINFDAYLVSYAPKGGSIAGYISDTKGSGASAWVHASATDDLVIDGTSGSLQSSGWNLWHPPGWTYATMPDLSYMRSDPGTSFVIWDSHRGYYGAPNKYPSEGGANGRLGMAYVYFL